MIRQSKIIIIGTVLVSVIFLSLIIIVLIVDNGPDLFTQTSTTSTKSIDDLYTEARVLFDRGDYAKAIAIYEQIMAERPNDTRPILALAHTYRYWHKHKESEQFFLAALEIDNTNSFIYTDLGKLYRNMNEYEKAEAAFKKSLSLDPNQSDTYGYGLGYLYLEQDRFAEAETAFKKALELDSNNEMANMGLGDLYREVGRYDESEAVFLKIISTNPKSESYLGLAWLYIHQERYDDAVEAGQNFLTNIREKAEVYYTIGVAYREQGDIANAKAAFTKAVELNPDHTGFIYALNELTGG